MAFEIFSQFEAANGLGKPRHLLFDRVDQLPTFSSTCVRIDRDHEIQVLTEPVKSDVNLAEAGATFEHQKRILAEK